MSFLVGQFAAVPLQATETQIVPEVPTGEAHRVSITFRNINATTQRTMTVWIYDAANSETATDSRAYFKGITLAAATTEVIELEEILSEGWTVAGLSDVADEVNAFVSTAVLT